MKRPLIILTVPTAVGKTAVSIQLAKALDGEIISADSMQVYRYMDVGTAKIRQEEMDGVPHHLVDEITPDTPFHVYEFKKRAEQCMEKIYERGKLPIVVGGTGFYIQALLYDIDFCEEESDHAYRRELEETAEQMGHEYLHQMLQKVDAASAEAIHPNNVKRVIRALEYYHETGSPISLHNKEQRKKESPYQFLYLVLSMERKKLYERIHERVRKMMEQGLWEEVRGLTERGYTRDLTSMQAIGYKEFFPYLDGHGSLSDVEEQIKKDTRHFAKRQMTWFRRERDVVFVEKDKFDTEKMLVQHILALAEEKGIRKREEGNNYYVRERKTDSDV